MSKVNDNKIGNSFQNQFVKLALRRLPHHILLAVMSKRKNSKITDKLNRYAKKTFLKNPTFTIKYTNEQIQTYEALTEATSLWHGTGRFQHGQDNVQDVLRSILSHGGLKPGYDAYAIFSGGTEMHSISLTPHRIIARSYADIHGKGHKETNRYGDALTWVSYFYGLFYAKLYTRNAITMKRFYKKWHKLTHDTNGDNTWGKKANKDAQDVWDVFGLGSDIADNYPIVIGVRQVTRQVDLSSVFKAYEVRTPVGILLADVTHIEVPSSKIDSTKECILAHGLDIAVLPIELGEHVASRKTFGELIGLAGQSPKSEHV